MAVSAASVKQSADNLRELLRRNRERYHRQLLGQEPAGWDYCVLTASSLQQARGYKLELERRRRAGWLPQDTLYLVVPDLRERCIGSGGASAYALRRVIEDRLARKLPVEKLRVLLINSGGDSRRLPHCSTFGKVFADLPYPIFPGGPVSTVFDDLMVSMCGLPERVGAGTVIVPGDILLAFDPNAFRGGPGVTGMACLAPWQLAARRGVYVAHPEGGLVRGYLHRPTREQLEEAHALLGDQALLDSGLLAFDEDSTRRLASLAGVVWREDTPQFTVGILERPEAASLRIDLYGEICLALLGQGAPTSRGTQAGRQASQVLTRTFQEVNFSVTVPQPTGFVHMGSTREWLDFCTGETMESRVYTPQWRVLPTRALGTQVAQANPPSAPARGDGGLQAAEQTNGKAPKYDAVSILSSRLAKLTAAGGGVIEYCRLPWVETRKQGLLSGVHAGQGISVPAGQAFCGLPLRPATDQPQRWVVQGYGIDDDPKVCFASGQATFQNRPFNEWLEARGIKAETLWPGIEAPDRYLWNARLFVPGDPDTALNWARWLYAPPSREEVFRWQTLDRMSFEDCFREVDHEAMYAFRAQLRAESLAEDLMEVSNNEEVSPQAFFSGLGTVAEIAEVTAAFLARLEYYQPFQRARAYQVLSDLIGDGRLQRISAAETGQAEGELVDDVGELLYHFFHRRLHSAFEAAAFLEDLAFDEVGAAIASGLPESVGVKRRMLAPGARAMVFAPARLDFAGGWSDTPPFSLEHGGTVLNAAILLDGERPIVARGEILSEPVLELISVDSNVREVVMDSASLTRYQQPSDPLALHKAAAVLAGFAGPGPSADLTDYLRHLGGGLRLITDIKLPQASGLGTGSITAMALLRCLDLLQGRESTAADLTARVFYLGQMLGTGGGWQDQLGGLIPGIKLLETAPGISQTAHITAINLSPRVAQKLEQQLLLCFVGERRLAKNLLRQVMRRYLSRSSEVVRVLHDIKIMARDMREALEAGALDAFGRLMMKHWELTKLMDRQTTTAHVERMFAALNKLAWGAKLAGAGGGGFMTILARDPEAALRLRERLGPILAAQGGRFYDVKIDEQGPISQLDSR